MKKQNKIFQENPNLDDYGNALLKAEFNEKQGLKKKIARWKVSNAVVAAIAILFFILFCLKKCESDRIIADLENQVSNLKTQNAVQKVDIDFLIAENKNLKAENDTLSQYVEFWKDLFMASEKKRKADEKIRPFLVHEEVFIDGEKYTRVGIIERNSDFYKGVTELLIPMENCQEYADSCFKAFISEMECVPDSVKAQITIESLEDEVVDTIHNDNFVFMIPFLSKTQMEMMVKHYGFSKEDYPKDVNCFTENANPRDNQFAYNFKIVKVDEKLQKKSKRQHIASKVMRFASMAGYAWLWHSDKQFAITDDGIGPYEDGNRFQNSNVDDLNIGRWKAGGEVGLWMLYGGSEWLDSKSYKNYKNSFQEENMQILYEREYLPYTPANKYIEYNK